MRGQWRFLRASSNLAIGTVIDAAATLLAPKFAAAAALALALLLASPSHALLFGEKARFAPLNKLRVALQMYERGDSHKKVWRKTGWYCPERKQPCRWESSPGCTRLGLMNITAVKHTTFTGEIPMWKMFNAGCVWQQYPFMRDKIKVALGHCGGALGTASSHDGKSGTICVSGVLLQKIAQERSDEAKESLHRVFLHELQHQVQFTEKWGTYNVNCPYQKRKWEREAFYVSDRESLSRKQKNNTPPHWFAPGLC